MSDETDAVGEVARVLYVAAHNDGSTWEDAPDYQRAFYRRQAAMLAEAGLLRDYAVNVHESCNRELGNALAMAEHAQIATQAAAEQPHAPSGGNGTGGGLGERLRAAADYQDRPGAYDELRAMADEADRLEEKRARQAQTIGEMQEMRARLTGQVGRVRDLAQWFRDQGQTGYARKVEEAVEGVAPVRVVVPQTGAETLQAIEENMPQFKKDLEATAWSVPDENPFRMPEDRA